MVVAASSSQGELRGKLGAGRCEGGQGDMGRVGDIRDS